MAKYFVTVLLFILTTGQVNSAIITPTNTSPIEGYKPIGKGLMKVLFWKVYQAQLFAAKTPFNETSFPQALKITYLRDIDKKDLMEATDDQWQHIGIESTQKTAWLLALKDIFIDIKKGETLTLVVDASKESNFYFSNAQVKNRHLGKITDVHFGAAFLAIWLSEKTSRPALRRQLLGE